MLSSFLHFHAGITCYTVYLVVQALVYQCMKALAEDVGLPNLHRVFFKLLKQIMDKLLALL